MFLFLTSSLRINSCKRGVLGLLKSWTEFVRLTSIISCTMLHIASIFICNRRTSFIALKRQIYAVRRDGWNFDVHSLKVNNPMWAACTSVSIENQSNERIASEPWIAFSYCVQGGDDRGVPSVTTSRITY